MIKALKKLKTWHRKKKKKKYGQPQPPPPLHCCSCSAQLRPTAPPLPPWLDIDPPHESAPSSVPRYGSFPSDPQTPFPPSDAIVSEITPLNAPPVLPVTTSYQQYLAPKPVYGVPVMPVVASREKSTGLFGCVIGIGTFLIRCLCPCFRFRDMN